MQNSCSPAGSAEVGASTLELRRLIDEALDSRLGALERRLLSAIGAARVESAVDGSFALSAAVPGSLSAVQEEVSNDAAELETEREDRLAAEVRANFWSAIPSGRCRPLRA